MENACISMMNDDDKDDVDDDDDDKFRNISNAHTYTQCLQPDSIKVTAYDIININIEVVRPRRLFSGLADCRLTR